MIRDRKLKTSAAVIAVMGACGLAIPQAVGSLSGAEVSGPQAERAEQAALEVAGPGEVARVDRGVGGAGWAVEIVKRGEPVGPWWDDTPSKRRVVVRLNRDFEWLSAR